MLAEACRDKEVPRKGGKAVHFQTMRIFALSDIHIDYESNRRWIADLSQSEYRHDVLILAGDVSDSMFLLEWCFDILAVRFHRVVYVPGNHDLWVIRDQSDETSFGKYKKICALAERCNISMQKTRLGRISIVPLLGWYDYSFGEPDRELESVWMDYGACRWPDKSQPQDITRHFLRLNETDLSEVNEVIISFSHFLPRLDLMPSHIPLKHRTIYPVLGSSGIEQQVRRMKSDIHIYGHSHVNRNVSINGVRYINNSFGYPHERWLGVKRLLSVYDDN